jgi:hypothetical protein
MLKPPVTFPIFSFISVSEARCASPTAVMMRSSISEASPSLSASGLIFSS